MLTTFAASLVLIAGSVVRDVVVEAARRADSALVYTAAANAASGVREQHARKIEEARALRDLDRLIGDATPTRTRPAGRPAVRLG